MELISWRLYLSLERERKVLTRRQVQCRQINLQKSVMHVQSCCFANLTYCFSDVLVTAAVVVAKAPEKRSRENSKKAVWR